MTTPDAAVLARTSVACARVAALRSYARTPHAHLTTAAALTGRTDGSVEVALGASSPLVPQLLARPLASVRVAPAWCEPVLLHGSARRLPGRDEDGRVLFRVEVATVRLGHGGAPVPPDAYAAAAPDPLREDAPAVLAHLNAGHADALTACLRACGHDVGFAQAAALDAGGLTVLAVDAAGVGRVRLTFPAPVSSLDELPAGLALLLRRRCACCCPKGRSGQA